MADYTVTTSKGPVRFVSVGEPITEVRAPKARNFQRADRAYNTLLTYQQRDGGDEDTETAIVDLMTDLLHMLDLYYGTKPEAAQRMAWHHFVAEKHEEEVA